MSDGATALLAHLIGLLFTFIGEELTLQIVQRIWTEVPRGEVNPRRKAKRPSERRAAPPRPSCAAFGRCDRAATLSVGEVV